MMLRQIAASPLPGRFRVPSICRSVRGLASEFELGGGQIGDSVFGRADPSDGCPLFSKVSYVPSESERIDLK